MDRSSSEWRVSCRPRQLEQATLAYQMQMTRSINKENIEEVVEVEVET